MDVHEPPWIRVKNRQKIRNNMSITIEPGIYLQDRFGVRIEDSVVVRGNEKNLCRFTKELIVKDDILQHYTFSEKIRLCALKLS